MKITPRKLLLICTALPIALLGILHATIQDERSKDIHTAFSRTYLPTMPTIIKEMDNPRLAQLKVFHGVLYANNYHELFSVDRKTFALTSIFASPVDPIIGWYFLNHKLTVTGANEKRIVQKRGSGTDTIFKSKVPINKNAPISDTSIIFASYDSNFANEVLYDVNLATQKTRLIPFEARRYNDGGMAINGEFIDADKFIIKVPYNLGQLFIFNKATETFSKPFTTVDSNLRPPNVIHFAQTGYRIDSKAHPVNSFGFYHEGYCFVSSNIYSAWELQHGYDQHFYIIDKYSIDTPHYVGSLRVPKNQLRYGRLIGGLFDKDSLILIYRKKILITKL